VFLTGLRALRNQNLNNFFAFCYLGLGMFALRAGPSEAARACAVAAAAVAVLAWAAALRRARAIADIATSRIESAAQGYVELEGRASVTDDNLIMSPLSGLRCIWYRYRVYSKDNSDREWRQIDSGVSSATFEIKDASGACRVDPDHAEVLGAETRTTYPDGGYKHVEELLFGGRVVYVLGEFCTIGGDTSALSMSQDVSHLLNTWKQDPAALKRRFDLNRDGEIDLKEWELARRLATKTVERQHREIRAQPGVHMVRAPGDGRLFLISVLSPQRMRKRFITWACVHAGVGVIAAFGFLKLLHF
jgi:hypothetical protein